ncbi:DUF4157 domain-containing protein [Phenylobacterium sp.]|uniref:eCIS core domain-containing protein n=1 Tax=Phenylobacterium sp. TaxID=1871053 RepID=UPI0025EFECE0|nr:DUF4157 domain-containing protein [Phenylobacterium sp.]
MAYAGRTQPHLGRPDQGRRIPAAERGPRPVTARASADLGPGAAVQRAMIQAVQDSPAMVAQRRALESAFGPAVQLQGGPEEELQMKRAPGVAQLAGLEDDTMQRAAAPEDELQMKRAPVAQLAPEPAAPRNDTGLPDGLKAGVETLSGLSMDGVKVHYNSAQPAQLNALAYAQGRDIHLGPGQERHLPHEAWHVAQQAQGRVQPTTQMKGDVPVNDDAGLEHEADVMGARAAAMTPAVDVADPR